MREDFERAIRQRDVESIIQLMFDRNSLAVKSNFRTEEDTWDYKADCPYIGKEHSLAWAELAKDVLAFHNNRGGVIVFGIDDKNYSFRGATTRLDSKLVNDQLRKYLGDRIWVERSGPIRLHSSPRFLSEVSAATYAASLPVGSITA